MLIMGRRLTAAVLSASILVVSPGLDCYQAFGAQMGRKGAPIRAIAFDGRVGASAMKLGGLASRGVTRAASGLALPASAAVAADAAPIAGAPATAAGRLAALAGEAQGNGKDSSPEAAHQAGARFDGLSAARPSTDLSVKALRGAVLSGALGLLLSISGRAMPIEGRSDPFPQSSAPADPVTAPVVVPDLPAPLPPSPVAVALSVDRQGATVGDRLKLTVTLKNGSDKPVWVAGLRTSLREALPESLEVQGEDGEEAIVLEAGQTKTIVMEVIPFDSGSLKVSGALKLRLRESSGLADVQAALPETVVEVQSVLPEDWRQKGFKDIAGALRPERAQPGPLAAIPLLLVLLAGAERILAARKVQKGSPTSRTPLLEKTRARLTALENPSAALGQEAFYAEVFSLLADFLVDFHGLPTRARDARSLLSDLKASGKLGDGELLVAGDLARRAEAVRFGGRLDTPEERARDLGRLKALVESVARGPDGAGARAAGLAGISALAPGAAGLEFGNPWALLAFVPWAGYLAWRWLHRREAAERGAYRLSSNADLPARRGLRERLAWLPGALRAAAMAAVVAALARPQLGITRQTSLIPSTDTVLSLDLSGSMDERFSDPSGRQGPTKLESAKEAMRAFVEEQRRGTTNRVGLVTFSDDPYLDLRLTSDTDALIAHLKELKTAGSTAVGKSMLAAIAHFVELNAAELGKSDHPLAPEFQKVLATHGLGAALKFAKPYPDLTEKVLRPERRKVVVLFTDGQSNTGIDPLEAAAIAKKLGVRVYSVGVAPDGESQAFGLDEEGLKAVAKETGARYFRAGDAQAMRDVLLEISRLEKNPVSIVSTVSVKDFSGLLVLFALAALALELALANTGLRVLNGAVALLLPLAALGGLSSGARAQGLEIGPASSAKGPPAEVSSANLLYGEGRYAEALRLYAQALERHPDMPELYFNLGNAQLKLGDADAAAASYRKYLGAVKEPEAASKAHYNLGNAALVKKDAAAALEGFKQALRLNPRNIEAKWNLEILKKALKQRGQGGGKGQPQSGQGQPQQGGQGQPSPQGQPSQPTGDGQSKPKPDASAKDDGKSGAESLAEKLAQQEKEEKEAARARISREGRRMWGVMALPFAFHGASLAFASPALLWVLAFLLPALAGALAYGLSRRLKAARLLSPAQAPRDWRSWSGLRRAAAKSGLALAAAGLLGLAAAGPQSGVKDERLNFGGKDILVVLDDSHSMVYAEDGRLARAKKELSDFIARLQGADRVGLVVFAGNSRTASPLSIDYGNFEFKVERLDREARGLGEGSNLVEAVQHATDSFETAKPIPGRRRVMIVLSDGDIFDQKLEKVIEHARQRGVTIYTVGIGTPEGTRMKAPPGALADHDYEGAPREKEKPAEEGYLMDRETGSPAVTRLYEEPLRRLARETGGQYFRAGPDGTIDRIMKSVAAHQKGDAGATLKIPRSAAAWFLWPALILLGLERLLPGKALLKPARRGGAQPMAGGLMLGGAGLSLSAWPMIFALAAAMTAVSGVLLADYWSGGALGRRLRWYLERRRHVVQKGIAADATSLFELRDSDVPSFSRYLSAWSAAPESGKAALVAEASLDEQLWRQKLLTAYLYGNGLETQELILAAITIAAKRHLQSPAPAVRELMSRRGQLPWLDHVDAAARVTRLAEAFGEPARSIPEARAVPSWKRRAAAAVSALGFSGLLAATGFSGAKSLEFRRESAKSVAEAERLFFGEDLYIFSDRYSDERIPREVLPALRAAWRDSLHAEKRLDRALAVLARSADPKADNVLEALFNHPDSLRLSEAGENALLAILLGRDNDRVWKFLDARMTASAGNPKAVARMAKIIVLLARKGDEASFQNLFRFLKSPVEGLRALAAETIYSWLTAKPVEAEFVARLGAVQALYSGDAMMNLWIEKFLLLRLSTAPLKGSELSGARDLLDAVLDAGAPHEAQRAKAVAAAGPGEEDRIPPSYLETALGLMNGVAGGSPAFALADTVKYAFNRSATALIVEGEKLFPELRGELFEKGLVPSETAPPPAPAFGRRGRGGRARRAFPDREHYREAYKLGQLRELKRLIAAESAAAPAASRTPEMSEYLLRAEKALEKMLALGKAAGMLEGGSPGEKLAEEVNKLLDEGDYSHLTALRQAGLAPDNGASGAARWRETYALEDVRAIRKAILGLAVDGTTQTHDGPSALSETEKLSLVKALDGLDALIAKNDPILARRAPKKPLSEEQAFWLSLKYPGQEKLVLTRMGSASYRRDGDMEFQYRLMRHLAKRLAGPEGRGDEVDEAAAVIAKIWDAAIKNDKTAETLSELARQARRSPRGGLLAMAARRHNHKIVERLMVQGVEYFQPGFSDKLVARGVWTDKYSGERREYKQVHLRQFAAAVEEAAAQARRKTGALTESQRGTLERVRRLVPRLIEAGAAAGLPRGGTAGELAAEKANDVLYEGYQVFDMAVPFIMGLREAGLAPMNDRYSREETFFDSYAKGDLVKIRKYLADMLLSGRARNATAEPLLLKDKEKTYLEKAIKELDGIIAAYGQTPASPAAKAGGVKLRDLGAVGLALLVPGASLWIAAVLAAGLLTWGSYKAYQTLSRRRQNGMAQTAPEAPSEEVLRRYRQIELAASKLASSVSPGAFRTRFIGPGGGEFAESRPYSDEDVREIDWRASARLGETYAKKYELEKEMPLVLLVDQSGSGSFGTQGADKKTVIQDAAAVLALAAAHHGLRVGAVLFTDAVEAFVPPRGGMEAARDLVRRIVSHESAGRGTDLRPGLQLLAGKFSARIMTAVVSDFLAPDFGESLAAVSARHDLSLIRVMDPAEARPIPAVGLIRLRDAETGETRLADTSDRAFREELAARHARREAALAEAFAKSKARPLTLSTEGDYLGTLAEHFDPKRKTQ